MLWTASLAVVTTLAALLSLGTNGSAVSAALGVLAVLAGFWVAIAYGTAAGASIALCSCAIFAVAAVAKPLLRRA